MVEATAAHRAEANPIYRLLCERTEPDPNASVQAAPLYQADRQWAEGEGVEAVTQHRFDAVLANLGCRRLRPRGAPEAMRQALAAVVLAAARGRRCHRR